MDEFRKIITIPKANFSIDRNEHTLLIGSCFSENIGALFKKYTFKTLLNPQGVLFNPLSITKALTNCITDHSGLNELYFHNEIWHSWQHNSSFSNTSKSEIENAIANSLQNVQINKESIQTIVITLGTAWAYRLKTNQEIVANCHKVPTELFEKVLLPSSEITSALKRVMEIYPKNTRWIFTISPVRHWKDGVRENNVSKGILHQAIHELLAVSNATYFPAYELLLDELRDYRFFTSDMLHPNELAIQYIWQRFSETYFDATTQKGNFEIEKILKSKAHKLQHQTTKSHQLFENQLKTQIADVKKNFNIEL
jgi:hypothetical protein